MGLLMAFIVKSVQCTTSTSQVLPTYRQETPAAAPGAVCYCLHLIKTDIGHIGRLLVINGCLGFK